MPFPRLVADEGELRPPSNQQSIIKRTQWAKLGQGIGRQLSIPKVPPKGGFPCFSLWVFRRCCHRFTIWMFTNTRTRKKGFKKGDKKKPHFHLVFLFDSLKSSAQVKEITDKIKSVGQLKVLSISGTIRYLTHKDCKDKYQYDEKDVLPIGGVDIAKYSKTEAERDEDLNVQFFFNF